MNLVLLRRSLVRHEGTGPRTRDGRFLCYVDSAGKTTIGYGRNLTDRGLSASEAEILLSNDINDAIRDLARFAWWTKLNDVRQRVCVEMVFNLGITGFLEFRQTLSWIAQEHYEQAATCMLASKWAGQVGARATRLAQMMRSGEDPEAE